MDDIKKKIYLKLYYSLLDWEWYSDTNTFRVFMHLLLTANRADRKIAGEVIKRGEAPASLDFIAQYTGLSVRNIRTALEHLQSTGEITKRKVGKVCVFKLVNYNKYQGDEVTTYRHRIDNEPTTMRQESDNVPTTPIYCKNEENEEIDRMRDNARTQNKNNKGNIRKPSYDMELAMKKMYRKPDPTKTKRNQ